jgi:4a-hydroxytetrahydrobiopterin dehydratase
MKNYNACLLDKTCTPCQGGVPPLPANTTSKLLLELGDGWVINESGQLYKEYNFNNFIEAMEFANKVADCAEKEAHHPDLTITWGKCTIRIWTHKINGLTENDFILAAKIGTI